MQRIIIIISLITIFTTNILASPKYEIRAAWITTIARNTALNEYNRAKRQTTTDFSTDEHLREGDFSMPDEDSFGLISLAKSLLDETDYKIVIMCAIAGYRRREAAKALDLPISTVSYRLKQSLNLLSRHLKGGVK